MFGRDGNTCNFISFSSGYVVPLVEKSRFSCNVVMEVAGLGKRWCVWSHWTFFALGAYDVLYGEVHFPHISIHIYTDTHSPC